MHIGVLNTVKHPHAHCQWNDGKYYHNTRQLILTSQCCHHAHKSCPCPQLQNSAVFDCLLVLCQVLTQDNSLQQTALGTHSQSSGTRLWNRNSFNFHRYYFVILPASFHFICTDLLIFIDQTNKTAIRKENNNRVCVGGGVGGVWPSKWCAFACTCVCVCVGGGGGGGDMTKLVVCLCMQVCVRARVCGSVCTCMHVCVYVQCFFSLCLWRMSERKSESGHTQAHTHTHTQRII